MYEKTKLESTLGFTLLEIMLTLGAIAVLTAGGIATYQNLSARSHTQEATQQVRTLSNMLMQTWGQSGSFASLSGASIVQNKAVPEGISISKGQMENPFGGSILLSPTVDNTAFVMTLDNVPNDACASMPGQLGREFSSVSVNGTQVYAPGMKIDVGTIAKMCGLGKNTLTLQGNPVSPPNFGEVALLPDHGNPAKSPIVPTTKGSSAVASVSPITALTAQSSGLPSKLQSPTVSLVKTASVSVESISSPPTSPTTAFPGTVLPPRTCFPSNVATPVSSTIYDTQTLGCPEGDTGSIDQQKTATQTVTTTTLTTCQSPWSAPFVTTTKNTTQTAWSAWATTSNTCSPMCSTRLGSYAVQYSYNWATINVGCPAGYSGTNSYQELQVRTNSAYCRSPTSPVNPVYGGWTSWSNTGNTQNAVNTCQPNITPPPTPSIASAMWGVNIDVSPSPTATSYQIGLSCQLTATGPVASTIQNVPVAGLPSTATNPNHFDTFSPAYRIGGIGETTSVPGVNELTAMTGALPQSQCKGFFFPLSTTAWVRACNSSGCSGWTSMLQMCSWGLC